MDEQRPLVSILITSYNYGRYLRTCIDSALNQSYSPVEVIVVDDGSTDGSRTIIDSFPDRVKVIFQENQGIIAAFNRGFSASQGDIICLLDSDDYFLQHKCSKVVERFRKYPEIGWYFHQQDIIDSEGDIIDRTRLKYSGKVDLRWRTRRLGLSTWGSPSDSSLCFARSLCQEMFPLPTETKMSVTQIYLQAIACASMEGIYDEEPLSTMRVHGENIYSGSQGEIRLRKLAQYHIGNAYWLKKNWPILSRFSNKTLSQGMEIARRIAFIDDYHQGLVEKYLSNASFKDRIEVALFSLYSRFLWSPIW